MAKSLVSWYFFVSRYITAATIDTAAATTTTTTTTSTTDTDTYGYGYLHAAIQQRQTLHGTCLKSL